MSETKRYDLITCGGCDTVWTGPSRCHCSASQCHRTFSGLALFDRHRVSGQCVDPATVMTKPKDGSPAQRLMFETDGIWQSVEEPAERGEGLRRWRERRAS